jgi:hypothetical protein
MADTHFKINENKKSYFGLIFCVRVATVCSDSGIIIEAMDLEGMPEPKIDAVYQNLLKLSRTYPVNGPIAVQIYLDLKRVINYHFDHSRMTLPHR